MKIWRSIAEVEHFEGTVGFVPTMGALHEGHLSLMRESKTRCGRCVASIFVNPTQFGPTEDFSRYPRPEERDFELAESAGVDAIFTPTAEEMYAVKTSKVTVAGVSDRWEGELRPGHFDGVATVVCKLFNIIKPSHAMFGEKDFQQCAVIASMVNSLNVPVELVVLPTIREADGLALSSRNRYLSPEHRSVASELFKTLNEVSKNIRAGKSVSVSLCQGSNHLTDIGFEVQYLALIDSNTLEPIERLQSNNRLIVAAKIGGTPLIDNIEA